MGFWVFMLVCNMLVPLVAILFGRCFQTKPPSQINGLYGYRTKRSMKNMETWKFAHHHCGKLWSKTGWVMLVISLAVMILFLGKEIIMIAYAGVTLCMLQCAVLLLTIIPVERALKKNFDQYGYRR